MARDKQEMEVHMPSEKDVLWLCEMGKCIEIRGASKSHQIESIESPLRARVGLADQRNILVMLPLKRNNGTGCWDPHQPEWNRGEDSHPKQKEFG